MAKVVLDSDAFKALASDTRLEILKALDVRRLTVTELGRVLDLNKATVFEHLKQLTAAGLVKKEDEGRKWIYYRLTWKGKNILHPEDAQIFLLLSTAALGMGGAVFALGRAFEWWGGLSVAGSEESAAPSAPEADQMSDENQTSQQGDSAGSEPIMDDREAQGTSGELWMDVDFLFFLLLLAVVAVLAALAVRSWLQRRGERQQLRHRLDEMLETSGS